MVLPLTCLYGGLNVAGYALTATLFAFGVRFKYWILHGEYLRWLDLQQYVTERAAER